MGNDITRAAHYRFTAVEGIEITEIERVSAWVLEGECTQIGRRAAHGF
jgi:hypothetical protein